MGIQYWETRAEAEARKAAAAAEKEKTESTVSAEETAEETVKETVQENIAETEIVDISEARREHDDRERLSREVDEFFEEEAQKNGQDLVALDSIPDKRTAGKILKYIFVDGLLGIPFLAVFCILISVLVVMFSAVSAALFAGALACAAGAVLLIINSFSTVGIHPQTGFFTFGAAFALLGLGLLLFVLAVLVASKVVPFIASLVDRLARKLRLFRN